MTTQEAVLGELRNLLLSGQLRPGEQIVQELLAERLEVSRVPVREALKTLEAEGQVRYSPHRGYFVTEMNLDELRETYRIRELLEDEAVRLAVPQLLEEDITRMVEALRDLERGHKQRDLLAVTAANRRFHFALLDASGQSRLSNLIRMLWDSTDPYRSLYFTQPNNRKRVNAEHRKIMEAVEARDVGLTITLLQEHRQNAVDGLSVVLAGRPTAHTDKAVQTATRERPERMAR